MKWKTLLAASAAGALAGYWVVKKQQDPLSPEKVLKKVKHAIAPEYAVSGTWIQYKPEKVMRFGLPYNVYKGGFSQIHAQKKHVHHEFIADAETGIILELK
ncbi:PepSY domain-containing protein [Fictibacillus aquaticus]|uniref:Uncharacterized protein n=1 Tax=Fictibacillus aquaticus TaxID=2021314 RepID=A0A235FA84_9BACL|nr:PepSY domain-containing protein [Fictibacillus aquaticus]OYD58251.1 hypothetical protein CGZ90_10240 [Fictibacillus aquaticus]